MKWLLLIAGGFTAMYFVAKSYVDRLAIGLQSFNFDYSENGIQYWNAKIRFTNPTPAHFQVNGFNVDFYYQGKRVGTVSRKEKFEVPGSGYVDFDSAVVIPVTSITSALTSAILNFFRKQDNEFTFVGTVNVFNFNIPVQTSYVV